MKIERNPNAFSTTLTISDEQLYALKGSVKTAADLVAVLTGLIQLHGDMPVWASDHSCIDSAWFRSEDDRLPDCIMIG